MLLNSAGHEVIELFRATQTEPALSLSAVVFIMLINDKMPNEQDKFRAQLS